MTSVPPVAPAQGIPAVPVVLTAGVLATVPPPQSPQGGPVPWTAGWVVVLNSSPFTLLVTSGGPVTQIAAFNSDKVFVLTTGTPLTVLPQSPAGPVAPGSDTTLFATWYHDEPPGQYPAPIGAGAVALAGLATLIARQLITVNNGAGNAQTFGPFPTAGFAGVTLSASTGGLAFYPQVVVTWFADAAGTQPIAARVLIVPDKAGIGGLLNVSLPHAGPFVSIKFDNQFGAGNSTITVNAVQTTFPLAEFRTDPLTLQSGANPLITESGLLTGAGLTVVQGEATACYAGPATWEVFFGGATAGTFLLQQASNGNVWTTIETVNVAAAAQQPRPWQVPVVLPAAPMRIAFTNQQGAGGITPITSLVGDVYRAA